MQKKILFAIASLLRRLDFPGIFRLADAIGLFMWFFLPRRRKNTLERVRFHLQREEDETVKIAKASFLHSARSFLEILLHDKFCMDYVRFADPDRLRQMCRTGQSAIFVSAHFGAWEFLAPVNRIMNRPTLTVVRKNRNPAIADLIQELRGKEVSVVDHRAASGPALQCLRKQGMVGFLADHNTSRHEAIFLPFLRETAAVNVGPAVLAVRGKAIVYPVFMRRDGLRAYTLHVHAPLDTTQLEGAVSDRVRQVADFYTRAIEKEILAAPEQWFWMHNRWKTRPHEA
ncbi:acyltransferase [Deltaproteobacteria bacterium]|nr:acyltransferase [Deltaproteobacteria bacterium]